MDELQKKAVLRLDELIALGEEARHSALALRRLTLSAGNLLQNVLGEESVHSQAFKGAIGYLEYDDEAGEQINEALGVLYAARDDIAGGFIFARDLLVSAANFGDMLEQGEHLLQAGYKDAAAVLIGAVLESTLRKLCDKHSLSYTAKETMEPLNIKLAKAGVYEPLTQKMITAWGALRNNAAHGHPDKYGDMEVTQMHVWVSAFVDQHLR